MNTDKVKKQIILNLPYFLIGLFATKLGQTWRLTEGLSMSEKILHIADGFSAAFQNLLPSFNPFDLLIGILCGGLLKLAVVTKSKNAKKYRHNEEYGSARWGKHEDIVPFMDKDPWSNAILTASESLTMSSRSPGGAAFGRNKNILVIGGSGSGKTRFFIKPNIMQCLPPEATKDGKGKGYSIVVTDPKGYYLQERCARDNVTSPQQKSVFTGGQQCYST